RRRRARVVRDAPANGGTPGKRPPPPPAPCDPAPRLERRRRDRAGCRSRRAPGSPAPRATAWRRGTPWGCPGGSSDLRRGGHPLHRTPPWTWRRAPVAAAASAVDTVLDAPEDILHLARAQLDVQQRQRLLSPEDAIGTPQPLKRLVPTAQDLIGAEDDPQQPQDPLGLFVIEALPLPSTQGPALEAQLGGHLFEGEFQLHEGVLERCVGETVPDQGDEVGVVPRGLSQQAPASQDPVQRLQRRLHGCGLLDICLNVVRQMPERNGAAGAGPRGPDQRVTPGRPPLRVRVSWSVRSLCRAHPNRAPRASVRVETPIASSADPSSRLALPLGMTTRVKPIFAASASRASAWPTARTSPASPTSPRTRVWGSRGRFCRLLTIAAQTARSQAGSVRLMPPATFTKRSQPTSGTSSFFSSTAASRATRLLSTPMVVRRAVPYPVGATRACTSTRSGRVPERVQVTTLPALPAGRSARKR